MNLDEPGKKVNQHVLLQRVAHDLGDRLSDLEAHRSAYLAIPPLSEESKRAKYALLERCADVLSGLIEETQTAFKERQPMSDNILARIGVMLGLDNEPYHDGSDIPEALKRRETLLHGYAKDFSEYPQDDERRQDEKSLMLSRFGDQDAGLFAAVRSWQRARNQD
jgi:hypothetical protein